MCWFSCGAASATATKLALDAWEGDSIIYYQDTGAEHPDNKRFIADCEKWYGKEINILKNPNFEDIWDVFEKTRWLVGVGGARCTTELKRKVAEGVLNHMKDVEVFGYTSEEKDRLNLYIENNPERNVWPILIEEGIGKKRCYEVIQEAGIVLPYMYRIGYKNNNCIGCVKGQQGYWNKIRKDFPEVFERMTKMERKLNVAINKKYVKGKRIRVFLDELDPNAGRYEDEKISCGLFCGSNEPVSEGEEI